jgi:hypothetical protein
VNRVTTASALQRKKLLPFAPFTFRLRPSFVRLAVGWWLLLIYFERKVLLADCWWLVCFKRKVLLAGG